MAKFVFRLQKVLDHRLRIEDEKKRAFVKARLAYLNELEKLDNLQNELDICNSKLVDSLSTPFQYIVKFQRTALLQERIEDQGKAVKVKEEEMNSKKVEFEMAQRDRKVIDKLKEKAQREYVAAADRLEQKQNDEFALYGYVRK
jgi:flagellar FliJ protein